MDDNTQFPEFEKLLEEENLSVYPEEFKHQGRMSFATSMIGYGIIPYLMLFFGEDLGAIVYVGFFVSLVGFAVSLREYVSYRSLREKYCYRRLSRKTISDALMYTEAHSLESEEIESPPPYHDMSKHSTYKSNVNKQEFAKFLAITVGLITWPCKLIEGFVIELKEMRKQSIFGFLFISVIILFLLLVSYFAIISMVSYAIAFGLLFAMYGLSIAGSIPRVLYSERHLLKLDWLTQIEKSDSIELDELMHSIFKLLQDEYHHPVRFHLWRKYPLLEYSSRVKIYEPHLQLKEAILYPLS
ncbi:MAG: hypothetical protein RTV72_01860 [Candidatus Thorarchaeota archaeon]